MYKMVANKMVKHLLAEIDDYVKQGAPNEDIMGDLYYARDMDKLITKKDFLTMIKYVRMKNKKR